MDKFITDINFTDEYRKFKLYGYPFMDKSKLAFDIWTTDDSTHPNQKMGFSSNIPRAELVKLVNGLLEMLEVEQRLQFKTIITHTQELELTELS